MKISISMYSLNTTVKKEGWTVVDFIEYAKGLSLDGVELLDIYWKSKAKDQEIIQVIEAIRNNNLQVSAYDVTNNFVKESSKERALEVAKVEEGIRIAKQLGTSIVRVFCGDLHENVTYDEGQEWIVEGLKKSAILAEQEQIYLAVENHGLLVGKSRQVDEIIRKVGSPYVKSTFDAGNSLLVHEKPQDAFDLLKNEIVHVHFKDFREKKQSEPTSGFRSTLGVEIIGTVPGDGQVDLPYIVEGLKEINYDGWLSIEYEGIKDDKSSNEKAVQRLRSLLG
ncbi:sugar phosphate isomerase/epimerase [Oceanobacillus luteolus]|uniref:sugar phosphate isomerase/epimerase family protein n=1 Tax=Oceanobacillus luteolus TaxID=1274358 RepID=UPI002040303D|nr:sugar phosphate isomerase/epimerase family protein [Oceanobacillus luteolus]MCM3740606.1 sugar phosphate isomerase/epimerase [Oceanobacillus luteolus]